MAKQQNGGKEPAERKDLTYPYYSFRKCIELAGAVKEYAGARAEAPKSVVAKHLSMSETSSSLSQLLVSTKTFGMIAGTRSYHLTDLGQQYFFPQSESDQRQAELGFFTSPGAFKLLVNRYDGNRLPPQEMLANVLHREAGVTESWVGRAAAIFVTTATELGLIDDAGFLRHEAATHSTGADLPGRQGSGVANLVVSGATLQGTAHSFAPPLGGRTDTRPLPGDGSGKGSNEPSRDGTRGAAAPPPGVNVWVYTEGGGTVRLETPDPLPRALWERLGKYVLMLEPAKPEEGGPK